MAGIVSQDVRVGPCGFCMRQAELFETFAVMEVQQTFYRLPQRATTQRWRATAPEHFEFTLKASQAITHPGRSPTYKKSDLSAEQRREAGRFRDTAVVRQAWEGTLERARDLRATWVIFQCPASFTPNDENLQNLRAFFGWAKRDGLRFGFEPRGPGWTDEVVAEFCRELELVHVVDPFERLPVHGAERYFRLHGAPDYVYQYSDDELARLRAWCGAGPTWCMFNNDRMREDAQRFLAMLAGE